MTERGISTTGPNRRPSSRLRPQQIILTVGLLALIVLLGGYFRFVGQNWDDFASLHPDERFLTRNLMPLLGGPGLEFTPDNDFPPHTALVTAEEWRIGSLEDLRTGTSGLVIGGVEGEISADIAGWLAPGAPTSLYFDTEAAIRGLIEGDSDVIFVNRDVANIYTTDGSLRALGTLSSEDIQRARCRALNPDTGGFGGYFDAYCSPLNPHNAGNGFYTYGTLPLFMAHFASEFVQAQEIAGVPPFDWQGDPLIWRFLSAFFDVGTIILVFMLGTRMHNRWVGLMAALLYAAAPLAIQKAHFGTVNSITTFFVTLALYAAVGVQDRGRLVFYWVFGVALGASVASRINTAPLAGVVVLAAILQAAPIFDGRVPAGERWRIFAWNFGGLVLAGITSLVAFRIFNPYAFEGPGFFGIMPHDRWFADIQAGSYGVSGAQDGPPNWQWLARPSYLYPLRDMLFWGMGIALGVMAWVGWAWSGVRIVLARPGALRNMLVFTWVLVYFAWMGRLWVMTMRYYLPLYTGLVVLAAWALWLLWSMSRERDVPLTRLLLGGLGVFMAAIPGYTLLAGADVTPTVLFAGGLAAVLLGTAIVPRLGRNRAVALATFTLAFTVLWGVMFSSIYREQSARVQASRWLWENISGDFSMQIEGAPEGTPLVNIGLLNSAQETSADPESLARTPTLHLVSQPSYTDFIAPASGTISVVHAPHLGDPQDDPETETLLVSLALLPAEGEAVPLAEATLTRDFTRENHVLGDSYNIAFDAPVDIVEGQEYRFKVEALDGPITSGGAVVAADEAGWDDPLTGVKICRLPDGLTLADNLPPGYVGYDDCNGIESWYGLVHSYKMSMSYPVDEPIKVEALRDGLDVADYVVFTSNRFYDTVTRNRGRFPVSSAFYDAIFAGELGFELVQVFHQQYELGLLQVSDQHLPIYHSPDWFNELEADEAFHVYDHPVVFIFKKTDAYDSDQAALTLLSEPITRIEQLAMEMGDIAAQLVNVIYWSTLTADQAPTALQMPEDVREINTEGGTWSERFDSDSLFNTNQVVGTAVWWLAMMVFGLAAWPLLFVMFPNMADRGYGFAKLVGLILVGFVLWVLGSLRFAVWSQMGVLVMLIVLALFSMAVVWHRRAEFVAYVRRYWGRLAWIEVITFALFLVMIGVRLTNPDIWHHPKGGEKPMDFAYFNAVLRTTVFPVADPWYAGGYINYYYWGYVLMGSPVLLLKIVPAFAYNLAIPTVFAMTGIGAFSAAFNIVDAVRDRLPSGLPDDTGGRSYRLGNPWVAGITALMLCVVLGNLDTPRVFLRGVADLGGYQLPMGLEDYLRDDYMEQYGVVNNDTGQLELPPDRQLELSERAAANNIGDRVRYEFHVFTHTASSVMIGFGELLGGRPLPIGTDRWYWGPSRVLTETPGVEGGAITEMPAFTFIYGDLHAHMINLPVLLFVVLFVYNEVRLAERDPRKGWVIALTIALGAAAVGLIEAINTWDWPAFLLLSVVGLGYAWWLRWQRLSRLSLGHLLLYVGGFIVLSRAAALPYSAWYAATYNSVLPWTGGKTPLWAYFDIHGLFLFLITALLIWETGRWFRSVKVKALRGRANLALLTMMGAAIIAVVLLALGMIEYQVVLIAVPLILWIVPLFFRPGQTRTMQFVLVIIGFALVLTVGVEFVVVGGDINRQNTVFKFYMQAWVLFSVAGGVAAAWLIQASDYWRWNWRLLFFVPLMILFTIASMYPIMAVRGRMADRMVPPAPQTHLVSPTDSLESIAALYNTTPGDLMALNDLEPGDLPDAGQELVIIPDYRDTPLAASLYGLDYMTYAHHRTIYTPGLVEMQDDYAIIRWLQENVQGTPVIMESRAPASEYTWTARIAINTGLPTVLGWRFHQTQQRTFDPLPRLITQREDNVKWFYETSDIRGAVRMLRHYDVAYVIVSSFERINGTEAGIEKFAHMAELGLLDRVHEQGAGQIYAVNRAELDRFAQSHLAFFEAAEARPDLLPSPLTGPGTAASDVSPEASDPNAAMTDLVRERVVAVLDRYDMRRVVIDNTSELGFTNPLLLDVLDQLLATGALTRDFTYFDGEVYRVDQSALGILPADDENANLETEG